ncbi:hypothetical protein V8J36_10945, partial [Frigidibacter sp. MR17.14]|uniref:hypothetical protein n=1 Tax=Frigidibacter sp. MR17.14 TaxID=3126509 RepID=UPI003012CDE8
MKPAFALSLAPEGIVLLERDAGGWLAIGEVGFDQEDAEGAIQDLSAAAHRRRPGAVASKLILPSTQILYLSVDAPGPDAATRRRQIARALEGRTPYPVDTLVYDWSGTGTQVKVAVVARETLDEAEAFAEANGFNPVSFVALPENGQFAGEPWFGQSASARRWIPEGERLVRDQDPVRVVGIVDLEAMPLVEPILEADPDPAEAVLAPLQGAADEPAGEPVEEAYAEGTDEGTEPGVPTETAVAPEPEPLAEPEPLGTTAPADDETAGVDDAVAAEDTLPNDREPRDDWAAPEPAAQVASIDEVALDETAAEAVATLDAEVDIAPEAAAEPRTEVAPETAASAGPVDPMDEAAAEPLPPELSDDAEAPVPAELEPEATTAPEARPTAGDDAIDPARIAATLEAEAPLPAEELAPDAPDTDAPDTETPATDTPRRDGLRLVPGEARPAAAEAPASLRGAMKRALGFGAMTRQDQAAPAARRREAGPVAAPRVSPGAPGRSAGGPLAASRAPEESVEAGFVEVLEPEVIAPAAPEDRAAAMPLPVDAPVAEPPFDPVADPVAAAPREDARWLDDVPPMPAIRMPAHGHAAASVNVPAPDTAAARATAEPPLRASVTAPKLGVAPEPRESHAAPRPPKGGKRVELAEGRRKAPRLSRGKAEAPPLAPGAPAPGSEVDERAARAAEAIARAGRDKQPRTRSRSLGLVLTLGLILAMVAVALGSMLFDGRAVEDAAVETSGTTAQATVAPEGAATDEVTVTEGDIPPDTALDDTTSAAQGSPDTSGAAQPPAVTPAPEAAPQTAAVPETSTESTAQAPAAAEPAPSGPAPEVQREAATTAGAQAGPDATEAMAPRGADPSPEAQAPGALAPVAGLAADAPPATPQPTLPYGTQFNFGPDGMVVATPEGALTPNGAVVRSGRPAVVPPARPGTQAAATAPASGSAAPTSQAPTSQAAATPPQLAPAAPPAAAAPATPPAPQTGLVYGSGPGGRSTGPAASPPPVRPAGRTPATQNDAALTPAPAAPVAAPA